MNEWVSTVPIGEKIQENTSVSPLFDILTQSGYTVSPEIRVALEQAIKTNPDLKATMQTDLARAEKNPSERNQFDLIYLKGYWQMVQLQGGKKMSFLEISGLRGKQKEDIIAQLSRVDKIRVKEYELEAVNQRIWDKKEVEQAVNQRIWDKKEVLNQTNEKLWNLWKVAKKSMDPAGLSQFTSLKNTELQQIQTAPEKSPIVAKLQKEWASIADIQSGKYNNYIDAYILTQHATELTPKDATKAKEFRVAVSQLSETMGIEAKIDNIPPFLESRVLGSERAQITNTLETAISTGKYETMRWDNDTRSIILDGKSGEKRIIETAKVPPTERLKNGAIEVSKELDKPKINIYTTERQSSENRMNSLIKNAKDGPVIGAILWSTLLEEWWKKVQEEKNPLERTVLSLETLGNKRRVIKELVKKAEENGEAKEAETLKEALPQIDKQIQDIIAEWQKLAEISKKGKEEENKTNTDTFGDVTRQNIEWLQKLGLSGFMDMSEVADFLSTQNSPTFGWEFSDRESINSYLGQKKLNNEQYITLLSWIVNIYQNITGTKELQSMEKSEQVRFLTRPTENGKTRLENAINSERIKQDGRPLNQSDFKRILANTEWQKSAT
jgi:hypothetical protein